ncbi:MAG: hypothetical protein EOS85_17215 [Mesorhizobium sp.]|nr:MAG: hypothetical protein EOS85_17215 [Mesorhizobium sp.]
MTGMTGALVALGGDRAAHDTYMQLAGSGLRIPAPALSKAVLLLYVQTLYIQTSYTALVNARSKLDERLARWLLMCHDRVRNDRFAITHESCPSCSVCGDRVSRLPSRSLRAGA